jgi:hypothetical protein
MPSGCGERKHHWPDQLINIPRQRNLANPLPGGVSAFFVASCLSNQFDLPGKRCAAREGQSGAGPLLIGGRNTAT